MKLNFGPALQQTAQTIGTLAQVSSQAAQQKFAVSQAADENLYNANARSAQIKVQDYMRELMQEASTNLYAEGFDLDAAGDDLSTKVYEFFDQHAGEWLKNDRYIDRFVSEVLDSLVAEMRSGVDETAFQVKNQIAVETANNTIDEALSMLNKGANPQGVYEIMIDSFDTIHRAQPMAKTQYDKKMGELNGAFNEAVTRTQLAKAVNSGRFSGEDILYIVDALQDTATIDKDTGWGAVASSIVDNLILQDDPTREGGKLKPFTDDGIEMIRDYAKSLLGVRENELSSVIMEHQNAAVQHFDKVKVENPDSFTLAAVQQYIAQDPVLNEHKDGAAYTVVKSLTDQARANQDLLTLRSLQLDPGKQGYGQMLGPVDDTRSVVVGSTTYGLWEDIEPALREEYRKKHRPRFYREDSYQQAEDMYITSVAADYSQRIMTGLFKEYDGYAQEYQDALAEYDRKLKAGEKPELPKWEYDRASIDADGRFDLLGPEIAGMARDAVYHSFTRAMLTPEAQQDATYSTLRATAMNQNVSPAARKFEIGKSRANLSDAQFKTLSSLIDDTPVNPRYAVHATLMEMYVREILGIEEGDELNYKTQLRYSQVLGRVQHAYDDYMLENPDVMTDEMADAWIQDNLDTGNKEQKFWFLYRSGDKINLKGGDGNKLLLEFQDGDLDKDLFPDAYAMLAEYTDSLMSSRLGIDPSGIMSMATNKGMLYSITADQHPDLAKWAGGDAKAKDVMVAIQWRLTDDGALDPLVYYETLETGLGGENASTWRAFPLSALHGITGNKGAEIEAAVDAVSAAAPTAKKPELSAKQLPIVSAKEDAMRMDSKNAGIVSAGKTSNIPSVSAKEDAARMDRTNAAQQHVTDSVMEKIDPENRQFVETKAELYNKEILPPVMNDMIDKEKLDREREDDAKVVSELSERNQLLLHNVLQLWMKNNPGKVPSKASVASQMSFINEEHVAAMYRMILREMGLL